jgi:two-component system, chemotaxis family, sensor kinase CheA
MAVFFEKIGPRLNALAELAASWVPGDLVHVAEMERSMGSLGPVLDSAGIPSETRIEFIQLVGTSRDLLDAGAGTAWIERLGAWLSSREVASRRSAEPEAPEAGPIAAAKPRGYPDDYFSNVIEDKKMLGQLCDEVREHLEIAQFTLVDIEYDSSNSENINKIFRAFHTIKSSGAFLGLKNVEETAHAMEDLLVMVRDGKISVSSELADVVFHGIGILRDLILIIETSDYRSDRMVESFRRIDIYPYIAVIKRIIAEHEVKKIGEILLEEGKLDQRAIGEILAKQESTDKKFGEIAVEEKLVSEEDFASALRKQVAGVHKSSYVKVSNDRLNGLIDIVGELVVNQSMIRQYMLDPESQRETAERTISQLESITTSIKNLVLSMGMVPIAEIFNKLRVVVRNTSSDTGKTVVVEFSGEDTELDRNVIETIYDPMVHIVRNAVDHGVEAPADREAAGKPRVGRIVIAAAHKGNGIEISVSDDGAGIDRNKVAAKAVKLGLATTEQAQSLSDAEAYALLFLPGFSTAEKVTEVSGRGVGLDVVKKNVEQIRGKVDIVSTPGKGSSFVIRIPLTLAIIDGFVTMVDGTKYIFPFSLIDEIIVPDLASVSSLEGGHLMLNIRERFLPIVFAADAFDRRAAMGAKSKRTAADLDGKLVIVLGYERKVYGIAVDSIIGKQEIVIKSLNEALSRMKVFSGGTIFGDGSIGFVVDVEEFILYAREER